MEFTNFNKDEFVREVAKETDWTLGNSLTAVNTVFNIIGEQILNGKVVSINGVGKFKPRVKPESVSIDLSQKDEDGKLLRDENGKLLTKVIPARYSVKFDFTPSFKQKVKEVPID
jgi:nucleoid DNA-binding protein